MRRRIAGWSFSVAGRMVSGIPTTVDYPRGPPTQPKECRTPPTPSSTCTTTPSTTVGSLDDALANLEEAQELLAENGPCLEPLHSVLINDDYPVLMARVNELEEALYDFLVAKPVKTPNLCPYCEARVGDGLSHKAGCPVAVLEDVALE